MVQTELKTRGFEIGDIDGRAGPKLEQAIRAYQFMEGLTPDGYASPALLARLKTRRRERARVSRRSAAMLLAASLAAASAEPRTTGSAAFSRICSAGRRLQPAPSPAPAHSDASPRPARPSRTNRARSRRRARRARPAPRPRPRRRRRLASKFVYVLGDSLAISAADGMVDDLQSQARYRRRSTARATPPGLVRDDYFDWAKAARELVAAKEPAPKEKDAKEDAKKARKTREDGSPAEKPARRRRRSTSSSSCSASTTCSRCATARTYVDPLTDRWKALYAQRIQAVVAPLHAAHVPVIWVGLPPMRSDKFNAQMIALNQMFKENAEKARAPSSSTSSMISPTRAAGFDAFGPNIEGQKVKLRGSDGIHLTPPAARSSPTSSTPKS